MATKIPQDLIDYLITMISPPDDKALFFNTIDEIDFKSYGDNTVCGIFVRGQPTEEQSKEFMRMLKPGAHFLLMAPDEEPTGHTGTCRIEDAGFEIRDSILYITEPGHFFYEAKASRSEREAGCESLPGRTIEIESDGDDEDEKATEVQTTSVKNFHSTVKPKKIMIDLLSDIDKNAGVVLDPFMGSGSTGIACIETGHDFIGIELEKDYLQIADARIRHWDNEITPQVGRKIESESPPVEKKETNLFDW
jgi:DNA modification methylase